ncbi:hypothetical protein ACFFJT_16960 [Dyella flava]|uniref:DUF2884 family protein n=1 Tax=Dyella flava TaxID=1920170 RepID=A0ABS2K653_9GAMM|nr:hypothetical protein [Dyella flava]MBM7125783.1 hypothetical protein [Dyella flava]
MKYQGMILLVALCAVGSACDMSDTSMANGAITLKNDIVTLHVSGAPDAAINAAGDLQVGDKVVTVNAAERGLLMMYYQSVHDVNHTGREMGKIGTKVGAKALKDKVEGKSKTDQDQDAEAGGQQLHQLSRQICQDQANIKTVQDQLTAQLADFKPYANIITQDSVTSCQKDDDDDKD